MVKQSSNYWGGHWTQKKLAALRRYLRAYKTALKKQNFELVYIDGCSGSGYWEHKKDFMELFQEEDKKTEKGSPIIALETGAFSQYVFIEKDKKTLNELKKTLVEKFPLSKEKMQFFRKDANDYIKDDLDKDMIKNKKRAVMFLDPFSIQVDYESIKIIAQTKAIDLWVLFPLMAANRLLKKDGDIPLDWEKKLNALFGGDEWKTKMYKIREQGSKGQGLLLTSGNDSVEKESYKVIVDFFVEKLKEDFGNKGVAEPKNLTNRGTPLFALCFASGNPRGQPIAIKIAQSILGKI